MTGRRGPALPLHVIKAAIRAAFSPLEEQPLVTCRNSLQMSALHPTRPILGGTVEDRPHPRMASSTRLERGSAWSPCSSRSSVRPAPRCLGFPRRRPRCRPRTAPSLDYRLPRSLRCAGKGIRGSTVLTSRLTGFEAGDSGVAEHLSSSSATISRIAGRLIGVLRPNWKICRKDSG